MYILEFKFNLPSVSVLTKSLNTRVSFTVDACFIQAITQELMIGECSQVGNLYVMDFNVASNSFSLSGIAPSCASITIDNHT